MRDARAQLFDAAERVLLRDGPGALTSRAVTAEAGCAKGVLHSHFADFDAFLADLVLDRVARVDSQAAALRQQAGRGAVADNLTDALIQLFGPVAVRIVSLVIGRDGLRARLRAAGSGGVPILTEAVAMVAGYLAAEQRLGRIPPDADIDTLAATLIGAVHLRYTEQEGGPEGGPVEAGAVHKVVTTVIAGVVRDTAG
jgi:AcrR family transcriptional regulator